MMRWTGLAIGLIPALLCGCGEGGRQHATLEAATLLTEDGIAFEVRTGRPLARTPAPRGMVMLMDAAENFAGWEGLARDARLRGYAVVVLRAPDPAEQTTFAPLSKAVITAASHTLEDLGTDANAIAIMGAGTGVCAALAYAEQGAGGEPLALLAPPMSCAAGSAPIKTPIIVMAGEEDTEGAAAARELAGTAAPFRDLKLFPGAATGAALCAESASATRHLFQWLDEVMAQR